MPKILDTEIYQRAKDKVYAQYTKHSAYRSGMLVKTYKDMGGRYGDDQKPKDLKRWFAEKWQDVGGRGYPVYRPTIRISAKTPLLVDEIDKRDFARKVAQKQKIKGSQNLKPFVAKK